jgi:hypothetical protein
MFIIVAAALNFIPRICACEFLVELVNFVGGLMGLLSLCPPRGENQLEPLSGLFSTPHAVAPVIFAVY